MRIVKSLVWMLALVSFSYAQDLNLNEVAKQAKAQNKQLMFFFHIPGCPYCERMLKENFKDKQTLDEIDRSFIFVDIYTGDNGEVQYKDFKGSKKAFAKKMKIFTYPTTQFKSPSMQQIHVARGYRNTDEYLTEIKYVASRAYKRMDLEAFAEELEFEKDD